MRVFEWSMLAFFLSLVTFAGAVIALLRPSWRVRGWRTLKAALPVLVVSFSVAMATSPPKDVLDAEAAARNARREIVAHEEAERAAILKQNTEAEAALASKRATEDQTRRVAEAEKAKSAEDERRRLAAIEARAPKPMLRDAIGCRAREPYDRLSTIAASGDREAFTKLAVALVATSQCRTLKQGTRIFLEDTAIFAGVLCGRPAGETVCFWLPIEIIK